MRISGGEWVKDEREVAWPAAERARRVARDTSGVPTMLEHYEDGKDLQVPNGRTMARVLVAMANKSGEGLSRLASCRAYPAAGSSAGTQQRLARWVRGHEQVSPTHVSLRRPRRGGQL